MAPTLIALMEEGWVTHLATNGQVLSTIGVAFQGNRVKMFAKILNTGSLEYGMKLVSI